MVYGSNEWVRASAQRDAVDRNYFILNFNSLYGCVEHDEAACILTYSNMSSWADPWSTETGTRIQHRHTHASF